MSDHLLDPNSPTWLRVKEWAENEIARLHKLLEQVEISEREADTARGSIQHCRMLLALAKPSRLPAYTGDDISED